MLGDGDKLIGQLLEAFVVAHLGLHGGGLIGRDALGELLALPIALENEIGAVLGGGLGRGGEELAAQRAAAHLIQRAHLVEDLIAALLQFGERGWFHGANVSIQIQ